jgi:hypothetical protein
MELSKYIKSVSTRVQRSQIRFADYNPRVISKEARTALKNGIKEFGIVGGIIVNRQTGYTIVGGHQKVSIMDELQKYNPDTKEGDYILQVDMIDITPKAEKELNLLLNNQSAQGDWDFDKLRKMLPELDWKVAGFTPEDIQLIGPDLSLKTEGEGSLAAALEDVSSPLDNAKSAEKAGKKEMSEEEKIAHNKEVKAKVLEGVVSKVEDMESYVMLTFDNIEAKAAFMERFGFDKMEKFIKGEVFSDMIERVD